MTASQILECLPAELAPKAISADDDPEGGSLVIGGECGECVVSVLVAIVTTATSYTLIAQLPCDQVCSDLQ
ncbi:hypothetical protein C482_18879 [Natrialba chahannaoensis JCM 10990]|uniref:Uncharacterized protein n=1 Tax=Natrialba chahannaoensis JCM 10990 TaxID=1227492 RepID=M0A6P7_9EURY|nr:hypothetical protein C482_18879 [Natrialba chahannaoensis JCM 10990]